MSRELDMLNGVTVYIFMLNIDSSLSNQLYICNE